MIGRRGFLGRMLAAPFGARMAAKSVIDAKAMDMAGIVEIPTGVGGGVSQSGAPSSICGAFRAGLLVPGVREELISYLYEQNQRIHAIDPDIANKRSFSLAAKIVYQRQRNVERSLLWHEASDDEQNNGRLAVLLGRLVGLKDG